MSSTSSDESSESESRCGEAASAREQVVQVALARYLQDCHLEKVIDEPNWHNKEEPDFHERTVVPHHRYAGAESILTSRNSAFSDSSSMAVSVHTRRTSVGASIYSRYAPSSYTPSLGSYSTIRSGPSISTSQADSFQQQRLPEDDESDVSQALPTESKPGRLACSFGRLGCTFRSDDLDEWDTHCKSHFRGHLPKNVQCPFRCKWQHRAQTSEEAWQTRLAHIIAAHPEDEIDTTNPLNKGVIEHLWRNRVIDNAQRKELTGGGQPADRGQAYTRTSSFRDGRRNGNRVSVTA